MPKQIIQGVNMGYIRNCYCGRTPKITTRYDDSNVEPGWGPFIIICEHGETDAIMRRKPYIFARSWYKTRAKRIWNAMICQSLARKS